MSVHDKYLDGLDLERLPAGAREVLIALGQFQDGVPVDQSCLHCAQPISVEALIPDGHGEPTAWLTRCPCGMCSGTFRGA
jgi:hypothetical protein